MLTKTVYCFKVNSDSVTYGLHTGLTFCWILKKSHDKLLYRLLFSASNPLLLSCLSCKHLASLMAVPLKDCHMQEFNSESYYCDCSKSGGSGIDCGTRSNATAPSATAISSLLQLILLNCIY